MDHAEGLIASRGFEVSRLNAADTAKSFYVARGYDVIGEHETSRGTPMGRRVSVK